MSKQLINSLIRLGSTNPDLRPSIRPILDTLTKPSKTAAAPSDSALALLDKMAMDVLGATLDLSKRSGLSGSVVKSGYGPSLYVTSEFSESTIDVHIPKLGGDRGWSALEFEVSLDGTFVKSVPWNLKDSAYDLARKLASVIAGIA